MEEGARSRTTETIAPLSSSSPSWTLRHQSSSTPGDEPDRRPQLLVDLGEQERVRLEERLHLVEERRRRLLGRLRPRKRGREPRDRVRLAAALGGDLLGFADAPTGGDEQGAVVPADEDDDAGDRDRDCARDDEPRRLALEDVTARERQAGEQRRDQRRRA